jgi:putative peptidoglycan lipid II flippase
LSSINLPKNSLLKSGVIVGFLIILGKVFSFIRDILISSKYGATVFSDAYFAANNVPSILFIALITSAVLFFIPFYNEKLVNFGEFEANKFASNTINVYTIISIVISLAGIIFAKQLVSLIAPGFVGERYYHTVQLTRILCSSFPFSCIALLLASISNARQRYTPPQLIPIVSSCSVILGIIFFSNAIGIYAVAFASVFAVILQAFLQKFFVKDFYKYQWVFKMNDKDLKLMAVLILPVFIGTSVDQINLFVDSVLSSNLALGSMSALNYGQRLQATINGTFSTAMVTILYPVISLAAAKREFLEIENVIMKGIRVLSIILIPITLIMMLDSYYIVKIVYFRGKFGEQALAQTSSVFMFYAIGLIFMAYEEMYRRVFYVHSDSKTPLKIGIIIVVIHLILSFIFIRFFKVGGLALATSLSCIISSLILRIRLKQKWGFNFRLREQGKFFMFLGIASIAMIICRYGLKLLLVGTASPINQFFVYSILSTICYFGILILFNIREINDVKTRVFNLFKKTLAK